MTKSELIEELTTRNEMLSKREAELIVNAIFDGIGQALMDGDRVEIRGFGSFTVRERDAREARNPRTGEIVEVDPKRSVHFNVGKELKQRADTLNDYDD